MAQSIGYFNLTKMLFVLLMLLNAPLRYAGL